jgi:hypothetical protein
MILNSLKTLETQCLVELIGSITILVNWQQIHNKLIEWTQIRVLKRRSNFSEVVLNHNKGFYKQLMISELSNKTACKRSETLKSSIAYRTLFYGSRPPLKNSISSSTL